MLASFSDQGIKNVTQTIERADAFKQMATKVGATIKDIYWTLGSTMSLPFARPPTTRPPRRYRSVSPRAANVRSETLRAFSFDEMKKVVGKMV